jgi:predicted nicotinamide N-methyase
MNCVSRIVWGRSFFCFLSDPRPEPHSLQEIAGSMTGSSLSGIPRPPESLSIPGAVAPEETEDSRNDWYRLWSRMCQRFAVRQVAVSLGTCDRYPWTEVIQPERVLDISVERRDLSKAEADPFWATLWRAYRGLVVHFGHEGIAGKRLLEVGCGQGAMGIAAAMMGAEVTLSDSVGHALLVAQIHAWPVRHRVRVRRLRWGLDRFAGEKFHIIAGSDVLYEPLAWDDLLQTVKTHLEPGGQVLFSEPPRITGEAFAGWMTSRGWDVRVVWIDLHDQKPQIRIFICQPHT